MFSTVSRTSAGMSTHVEVVTTTDEAKPRGQERLNGDSAARIVFEHRIQDGVRDLVGHLVRVTLGNRFGREQAFRHVSLPSRDGADQ